MTDQLSKETTQQEPKPKPPTRRQGRKFVSKILLRVTPTEHQRMKKRAADHDLSLSRFAVESALRERPLATKAERERQIAALFELRKIGNNLNQVAHGIHSARLTRQPPPTLKEIQEAVKQVSDFITEIKKTL
jgi:hypothetical protein